MGNCPPMYYDNCRNNQLCGSCSLCGGDTYLYSPLVDIGAGPLTEVVPAVDTTRTLKKRGKKTQKDGYQAERDIFTRLGGRHNPTSQGYDGTIMGSIKVEYKVRLAGGPALPTKAEWAKAQEQGNRLVIVEDKAMGTTTVTMTLETFESIRYDRQPGYDEHNWPGDGTSRHGP